MNKQKAQATKEASMGDAYVGLWTALHDPRNSERVKALGDIDALFARVSMLVNTVNEAKASAEKRRNHGDIARAEASERGIAGLLCQVSKLLESKETTSFGAKEGVADLLAKAEEKAQELGEKEPVRKQEASAEDGWEQAEARFGASVEFLMHKLHEFAPEEMKREAPIMSNAKIMETIRALSPDSLKLVDEALFGENGYFKNASAEGGIRRLMIGVACSVVDDLTGENGKVDEGQLKDALDYLSQKEKENMHGFWGKVPAPCWTEAMKIANALRRGMASRGENGKIEIIKG